MRSQFVAAALGTASLAFGQEDVPREAPEVYGGGLTILAQNELTSKCRASVVSARGGVRTLHS